MNAHDMSENDLHAFVDGQLARGRHHKMVVHLATHPDAAERVRAFVLQREGLAALRDSLADDKVGEPLIKLGRALDRMVRRHRRVQRAIVAGGTVMLAAASASPVG